MATRHEKYEDLVLKLQKSTLTKLEKELESMHRHLNKHKDTFSHSAAPDELTDGDRVMAIKEAIREKKNATA